jgi:hypothetical protein
MVTTADAVAREAAWLRSTGDQLPSLLAVDGGPWDVVQAYLPRTPADYQSQLYVLRRGWNSHRFAEQRRMPSYQFHLVALCPIGRTTTGEDIAEDEQQAFDNALDLVRLRIEGYVGDKSHGGRFLSVGETPDNGLLDVQYQDPAQGLADGFLSATIAYGADDSDYVM